MLLVVSKGDEGVPAVHSALAEAAQSPCLLPLNAAADAVAAGYFRFAAIALFPELNGATVQRNPDGDRFEARHSEADAATHGGTAHVDGLGDAGRAAERLGRGGFVDWATSHWRLLAQS